MCAVRPTRSRTSTASCSLRGSAYTPRAGNPPSAGSPSTRDCGKHRSLPGRTAPGVRILARLGHPSSRGRRRLQIPGRTTVFPAALLAGLALTQTQRQPLLVLALVLGVVWLNAHASLYRAEPVPAVLDELPAVCARIAVAWCVPAALLAALFPAGALSARTLAVGCVMQSAASCAGRGALHWRRRRALVLRPGAALVIGPAATAQRVAAAFLRHPACGVRPVGIVADQPTGGDGLPVLTT